MAIRLCRKSPRHFSREAYESELARHLSGSLPQIIGSEPTYSDILNFPGTRWILYPAGAVHGLELHLKAISLESITFKGQVLIGPVVMPMSMIFPTSTSLLQGSRMAFIDPSIVVFVREAHVPIKFVLLEKTTTGS